MVRKSTKLIPIDRSGVWWVRVFHLYKGGKRKVSTQGNSVYVSVRSTRPENWILKKAKQKMLIIRVKKEKPKQDGSYIKFFSNCAIFYKKKRGVGRRNFIGPVLQTIRRKKVFKYAPKVI